VVPLIPPLHLTTSPLLLPLPQKIDSIVWVLPLFSL
jgi:hypothetical protein